MMNDTADISIQIMGKVYQVKCPQTEVNALQCAAQYLEEKMRLTREAGIISFDRVAMITALNVAHQLLTLEQQKNQHAHAINQRLIGLQDKIDNALVQNMKLEIQSAK